MSPNPASDPGRVRKKRPRLEFEARAQATVAEFEAQMRATKAQLDALEERIEARTGRNLPLAIVIGLALGFALLFSLIVVKELFLVFAGVLIGFTVFELASALRFAGRDVPRLPSVVAAVALVPAAFYWQAPGLWLVFLAGVAFVALWRVAELVRPSHRARSKDVWTDLAAGALIQAYVGLLGSFAALLTAQDEGEWWTLAFLIVVIASDTGAYASGLLWGAHPMAPRISPKKTWEGFIGAATVAVVAGVFLAEFMIGIPWWAGMIFGLVLMLAATMGDLIESLMKRDLGIKDISTWLPGHGGFLDRADSALPSAAVAYVMFLVFT